MWVIIQHALNKTSYYKDVIAILQYLMAIN